MHYSSISITHQYSWERHHKPDVEVLHETEQPCSRILASLLEAFPGCASNLLTDGVSTNPLDAKLSLFGSEPSSLRRVIGQQEEAEYCDKSGDRAFDDEKPRLN